MIAVFFSFFSLAMLLFVGFAFANASKGRGSAKRTPTNQATLFFEHFGSIWRRFWPLCALVGVILFGLNFVVAHYGSLAAAALMLSLFTLPTLFYSPKLGVATTVPLVGTDERLGENQYLPVAAATKVPQGVIAAIDTSGRVVNGADTAGLRVIGRAEETSDNTSGAAGDLSMNVRRGCFKWANSATNAITAAMVGKMAYVEDNQTVASTTTYKVPAGRIVSVETDGVFVDTRRQALIGNAGLTDSTTGTAGLTLAAGVGVMTVSIPLILSKIGNAAVLSAYTPGYAFKLLGATVAVTSPVTTGAKAATLTPSITGVNVTGGVVALTSANCTPLGALVAGSAVTAANTGTAADTITITGSGVTAFVEGEAVLLLKIQNMDTANAIASLAAA